MEKQLENQIKEMKKVVLHLHLDGSLRPETVYKWLKEEGKDVSFEEVKKALMVEKDCRDLTEYLEKFDLPCKMLQTEEHIEQATYELFEDLAKQNVIYAEVRFAPSKHKEKGLDNDKIVEAAISGMEKAKAEFGIDGSLILCAMRGEHNIENKQENFNTIKTAKKYLGKGVSGADLAGAEALFPTEDYEDVFDLARHLDVPVTIHAGEADGPESIKDALEFGAKRIGHGVRCLEDPHLVGELAQEGTVLEVCPTSNLQTKATSENHPIEKLYRRGLSVTINPDNNSVSNTNIIEEYKWVLEHTDLTINDLKKMNINAIKGIFGITKEKKARLIGQVMGKENEQEKNRI